jgi:signal peptide peptidase SppA
MNSRAVMSYLTSRQWAMDPAHLQSLAESIAMALEKIPPDTLRAAQEAASMRPKAGAASNAGALPYDLRDGVAHIRVSGVILKEVPCIFDLLGMPATSTLGVQRALGAAVEDEAVKSISLDIDSPGGSLAGVQELADDVAAAASLKPTVAHASDLIASAAYWIGSQASKLTANEAAMVGSIGVYSVIEDASAADAAAGIKVHVLRSSPLKGAGAGDGLTTAQLADQQRIVDEAAVMFTTAVARGRQLSMDDAQKVATGQLWFAAEAKQRGLIDSISSSSGAHAAVAAVGAPQLSQEIAPSVGALQETIMSDPKNPTTQADAESVDKLKAELAASNARNAALEANAKALEDQRKEALLAQYRDRIAPAALAGFQQAAASMGAEGLEKWLKDLPVITRAARATADGAIPSALIEHVQASIEERSLAKVFGQSPERCRDMQAIGDNVDHVEYEKTATAEGKIIMEPVAVLKDGSRATRKELRGRLGMTGAVAAILFAVLTAFSTPADAGALSAARATQSKASGIKWYKMKASTTIYAGGLVMVDSNGLALPAAASATNHGVMGVATETKTSAASGTTKINVAEGYFLFDATSIAQANVGSVMYASDDRTFDETQGANEPVAGILVEYVGATSGWLYISPTIQARAFYTASDPLTLTGDLTIDGGAGALTFGAASSSVVTTDNAALGLVVGSTGHLNTLTLDTRDGAEGLTVTGYTTLTGAVTMTGAVGVTGNVVTTGTITSSVATSIGWSLGSGANTACNTTCTYGCVFGQNTATYALVDCADATADLCICAGAN